MACLLTHFQYYCPVNDVQLISRCMAMDVPEPVWLVWFLQDHFSQLISS